MELDQKRVPRRWENERLTLFGLSLLTDGFVESFQASIDSVELPVELVDLGSGSNLKASEDAY